MAQTTVSYSGNGSDTFFTIPYSFTVREAIQVYLNAVLQTAGTDYTFLAVNVIAFAVAPPNGSNNVEIRRVTPTAPLVDFENGAGILEESLDLSTLQLLHITEELANTAITGMERQGINWDADRGRIADLGPPILDLDATTKQYVDNKVGTNAQDAEDAQAAAEAAQAEAEASSLNAQNSSASATNAAIAAANSEANAAGSLIAFSGAYPISGMISGSLITAVSPNAAGAVPARWMERLVQITVNDDPLMDIPLPYNFAQYFVEISGYRPRTDNTDLSLRVSTDGGVSFHSGGSHYSWQRLQQEVGANDSDGDNFDDSIDLATDLGSAAGEFADFRMTVTPGDGVLPCRLRAEGEGIIATSDVARIGTVGVVRVNQTRVTHLRLYSPGGRLDTGLITVWGIRR